MPCRSEPTLRGFLRAWLFIAGVAWLSAAPWKPAFSFGEWERGIAPDLMTRALEGMLNESLLGDPRPDKGNCKRLKYLLDTAIKLGAHPDAPAEARLRFALARNDEKTLRDQMVDMGCNRKSRSSDPSCIEIYNKIDKAVVERKAAEQAMLQGQQPIEQAVEQLRATIAKDCPQTAARIKRDIKAEHDRASQICAGKNAVLDYFDADTLRYRCRCLEGRDSAGNCVTKGAASADSQPGSSGTRGAAANHCSKLAGTWSWFTGPPPVVINVGGTFSVEGKPAGNWTCTNSRVEMRWHKGGYIDTLTLSPDGSHLSGKNQYGTRVTGDREGSGRGTRAGDVRGRGDATPRGTIIVRKAIYGGNCNNPQHSPAWAPLDVTADLAASCNAQVYCEYLVNHKRIGDPAVGCRKNFYFSWSCAEVPGSVNEIEYDGEASGKEAVLSCREYRR